MTGRDALLRLAEVDSPAEIAYFEQFAALVEDETDIDFESHAAFFSEADPDTLSALAESYFEILAEGIPEDRTDFRALTDEIGHDLSFLAADLRAEGGAARFTEAFVRFRRWYLEGGLVRCDATSGGDTRVVPVAEALTLHRLERLGETAYAYDFTDCMDYPLDFRTLRLGAFAADDEDAPE